MDARTKKVSLDFMGDGWAECYVEMRYLTWADSKKMVDAETEAGDDWVGAMVAKVSHVFVSGKVLSNGEVVELTKDGIAEFDLEALKVLNNAALGFTDPKE
jgi:hypothetical protein